MISPFSGDRPQIFNLAMAPGATGRRRVTAADGPAAQGCRGGKTGS